MTLEHGSYTITVDNDIIVVSLKDSFNEYATKTFIDKIKTEIDSFNGKPFSILVNDIELEGLNPESYEELDQYNL